MRQDFTFTWIITLVMSGLLTLVVGAGCEESSTVGNHNSSDGDSDTDSDSDSDSDSDTDIEYDGPSIPPTCEEAEEAMISVGCEFYAADLDNVTSCDVATYAIVVSNPHEDQDAVVVLDHGTEGEIYSVTLAPGELNVIDVSCADGCLVAPQQVEIQGKGVGAGFRLSADVPILAYQWNPYGAELFSTDASLLFPTATLGDTYIAAAWGEGSSDNRSQLTVVATEDNTILTFTPSTPVPSLNGVGPISEGSQSVEYTLNRFDVIAISPLNYNGDLTGTVVLANNPVAVFGGHGCANVPTSSWGTCDHVEEQVLPLAAWGTSTVLAKHGDRQECSNQLVAWRIIAGAGNMTLTFDPPAPEPYNSSYSVADQGEVITFGSDQDHYVEGTLDNPPDPEEPGASFFAYQLMSGCIFGECFDYEGDPMMLQSAPAGQFLDRYVFNTDDVFDFAYDYAIIVRPAGSVVTIDCLGQIPDSEFTQVGGSNWEVARVLIDNPENTTGCLDGAHVLTATARVGLSVAGSSHANSYGYLGGVGVRSINPAPTIE